MENLMQMFGVGNLEDLINRIKKLGARRFTITQDTAMHFTFEFDGAEQNLASDKGTAKRLKEATIV